MSPTDSSPDKRARILEATLHLLSSRGFHGFSVRQLAEQAGVATGTVYLYFRDRDDLIYQLHADIVQQLADHLFAGLDHNASEFERYRRICLNFWQFWMENPELLSCKSQFDSLPAATRRLQIDEAKAFVRPLFELFDTGRKKGVLRNLADDVLVTLAIDPFSALANKQRIGLVQVDEQCLDECIQACWNAISH
ncbi:MAG: TetR/AcrR family transcriptional regulator [Ketobacteraceae bacterium]|nr:TetR/AcrR family transcriptional regulator [Ketobacteraceae bacterium]